MSKTIVIMGSSRSKGGTFKAVQDMDPNKTMTFVDLLGLNISPYDYEHKNKDDDFLPLMEQILEHDQIVLATPVYWYAMSTQLKMFFDRITDCVSIRKELGRALKGKKVFLLVSYSNPLDEEKFEYPIKETVQYLDMEYEGAFFHYSAKDAKLLEKNKAIEKFSDEIVR